MKSRFLRELQKHRVRLRNVHQELRATHSRTDRFALWITQHVGTVEFFLIIFLWTVTWLLWNSFGPQRLRFDNPNSGFVIWLFISNVIQLILMPLIMVGQNVQGRHNEELAEHDYEINVKAEKEVEIILHHIDHLDRMLVEGFTRLGVNMPELLETLRQQEAANKEG